MGQNFSSEPVVEKDTERDHNDTFNVAVSSCQGWRMSQEDNHSMMLELPGEHKAAFFAVYDGHGSDRVSKHASEGLWRHLVEQELYEKGNFKEALENAFLTFDREVSASYNAQLAGTTAVCLLIVDNMIYCANIGDSRGVACVNCECVPLSYDHKPENPQELKRILAAGGYVLGNRVNGNLALSRAFGDFHYKGNEQLPAEQQIVSPCPDVKRIDLNDDVDFLVLACDGIWDVLSSEEVVEFVISRLEENMEPGLICEQLTTRCLATDYELVIGCDNMTVLLVCYTRGRSWNEFCTDIFNKHTRRLGVPRKRPTLDDSAQTSGVSDGTNDSSYRTFDDLMKRIVVMDGENMSTTPETGNLDETVGVERTEEEGQANSTTDEPPASEDISPESPCSLPPPPCSNDDELRSEQNVSEDQSQEKEEENATEVEAKENEEEDHAKEDEKEDEKEEEEDYAKEEAKEDEVEQQQGQCSVRKEENDKEFENKTEECMAGQETPETTCPEEGQKEEDQQPEQSVDTNEV